jgi:hypothetical protein
MLTEGTPPELLIRHKDGQRIIACGASHYWSLVRAGKIEVVGRGKGSRGYLPSILKYVDELLAEAKSEQRA